MMFPDQGFFDTQSFVLTVVLAPRQGVKKILIDFH